MRTNGNVNGVLLQRKLDQAGYESPSERATKPGSLECELALSSGYDKTRPVDMYDISLIPNWTVARSFQEVSACRRNVSTRKHTYVHLSPQVPFDMLKRFQRTLRLPEIGHRSPTLGNLNFTTGSDNPRERNSVVFDSSYTANANKFSSPSLKYVGRILSASKRRFVR